MRKIISTLMLTLILAMSNTIVAKEPIYLKCSGFLSTTRLNNSESRTQDHGTKVIAITIDDNKIRVSGGDAAYSMLMPKTEFSVCKANEVIEFYSINDQNCKLAAEEKSVDFYSGEYNRILDTLVISRQRNSFSDFKNSELKTNTITTGGEFHCKKVKL